MSSSMQNKDLLLEILLQDKPKSHSNTLHSFSKHFKNIILDPVSSFIQVEASYSYMYMYTYKRILFQLIKTNIIEDIFTKE